MLIEICANSFKSALNAQKAGAHRIELCSELSVGGITPSYGLLQKVSENIEIPVHVLIRPRSGDFCYTDDEFKQMKTDITICKKLGFQGIVSGVLNSDNKLDIDRAKELIKLSKPLSFTFHRAFDCVPNPLETQEILKNLKVDRILTSGQKNKAIEGIDLLKKLNKKTEKKLIILPGSGINATNILQFKKAGFSEIHTSASIKKKNDDVFFDKTTRTISDLSTIKQLVKMISDV